MILFIVIIFILLFTISFVSYSISKLIVSFTKIKNIEKEKVLTILFTLIIIAVMFYIIIKSNDQIH